MRRQHKELDPRQRELSPYYLVERVGRWFNLRNKATRLFRVPACVLRRRSLEYLAKHRASLDH